MKSSFHLLCFSVVLLNVCLSSFGFVASDNMYVLNSPGDNLYIRMWLTSESDFIRFLFQGCSDIHISLIGNPRGTDSNGYEVIIGGWSNTKSVIRRGLSSETVVQVLTPDILSCNESRPFWISWQNGNITIGSDNITGQESFMSYADPQPYPVVAVLVTGGTGGAAGRGTYYFYKDEARMAIVTTPPTHSYGTFWLLQTQKSYVKFGVRTCNDAILALSSQMDASVNTYEVVIGGSYNTWTWIRPGYNLDANARKQMPGLLSCDDTRYFWISYVDGFIAAGRELELGKKRFISWRYQNPHNVTAIGFSGYNKANEWEFSNHEEAVISLRTHSDNPAESNWMDVIDKSSFCFRLKACSFGKIEMRSDYDRSAPPDYQIIIGGSEKYQQRNKATGSDVIEITYLDAANQPVTDIFEVQDLLKCGVYRRFWLSWQNQKIQIGRDDLFTKVLVTVDDPVHNRNFRTLRLGTGDPQQQQEWEFALNTFRHAVLKTSSLFNDSFKSHWVTFRDEREFYVLLKACSDARIILASYTKVTEVSTYEVLLGGNGNQISKIGKDGFRGRNVVEVPTPNILHCNQSRYFWFRWSGTVIQVGYDRIPGKKSFMQLVDPYPYKIRAIAFDTVSPNSAIWEFHTGRDPSYVVQTPANYFAGRGYFQIVTNKMTFAFEVKACKNAVVSLSDGTHFLAEVVIGSEENTKCEIKSLEGMILHNETRTPNILNCQSSRTFWIQYIPGQVIFGSGEVNDDIILRGQIPRMVVKTLSVSTRGVNGTWTFDQQSGEVVETETPKYYGYNNAWITVFDRKTMVFGVEACNNVHIALSTQLGQTSINAYEVVLGANSNTKSLIRNGTQGSIMAEVDTSGIVDCSEMRIFWLGWDDGCITVGRGGDVGSNQFMNWKDPNPYTVHALGISSGFGAEASWRFNNSADAIALDWCQTTTNATEEVNVTLIIPTSTAATGEVNVSLSIPTPAAATGEVNAGLIVGIIVIFVIFIVVVLLIVVVINKRRRGAGIQWFHMR